MHLVFWFNRQKHMYSSNTTYGQNIRRYWCTNPAKLVYPTKCKVVVPLNSLCAQLPPLRQSSSTILGKVFSSLWHLKIPVMDSKGYSSSKEFKPNASLWHVWLFHRLYFINIRLWVKSYSRVNEVYTLQVNSDQRQI